MIFMNALKEINSQTCPWWLIFTFDNVFRRWYHDPKSILGEYVRPGDTALDVGCGIGYFTIPLAELVGENGMVIAADLQEQMLKGVRRRSKRSGLEGRIRCHLSQPEAIGVTEPVDFALAFWMVHEVRQPQAFLREIYDLLKPGGRFLLVEPVFHVSETDFKLTSEKCETAGFRIIAMPKVRGSRALLLQK